MNSERLWPPELDALFNEDYDEESKNRMKKYEETIEFIGPISFWNNLPSELQKNVVSHLDTKTKLNLAICSKQDNERVKSTPLRIYGLEAVEFPEKETVSVKVKLDDKIYKGEILNLEFKKEENGTLFSREFTKNAVKIESENILLKGRDYKGEFMKTLEFFMKHSAYCVPSITFDVKNATFSKNYPKSLKSCKIIRVSGSNISDFTWWLDKLPANLDQVHLVGYNGVRANSDFFERSQIMNAKQLSANFLCDITDNQFLQLKAEKIRLVSTTLTDAAFLTFIKRWANGKVDPNFQCFTVTHRQTDISLFVNNLLLVEWNEEFETNYRVFVNDFDRCMGEGTRYQYDKPGEKHVGATLHISKNSITFMVTSRPFIWDGDSTPNFCVVDH